MHYYIIGLQTGSMVYTALTWTLKVTALVMHCSITSFFIFYVNVQPNQVYIQDTYIQSHVFLFLCFW